MNITIEPGLFDHSIFMATRRDKYSRLAGLPRNGNIADVRLSDALGQRCQWAIQTALKVPLTDGPMDRADPGWDFTYLGLQVSAKGTTCRTGRLIHPDPTVGDHKSCLWDVAMLAIELPDRSYYLPGGMWIDDYIDPKIHRVDYFGRQKYGSQRCWTVDQDQLIPFAQLRDEIIRRQGD